MAIVNLTARAYVAVRGAASGNSFEQTGTQRPDGSWDVPLGDETVERLRRIALRDESLSDTIERVIATAARPPQ